MGDSDNERRGEDDGSNSSCHDPHSRTDLEYAPSESVLPRSSERSNDTSTITDWTSSTEMTSVSTFGLPSGQYVPYPCSSSKIASTIDSDLLGFQNFPIVPIPDFELQRDILGDEKKSDVHLPPLVTARMKGLDLGIKFQNDMPTGKAKATETTESGSKSKNYFSSSQASTINSSNLNTDPEDCSIQSSMQTDITQPSPDSDRSTDSATQQPGELDYLLDPTGYFQKLDDLEIRTAQRFGLELRVGPRDPSWKAGAGRLVIVVPGGPAFVSVKERLAYILDNAKNTMYELQSEDFCGRVFSFLAEDTFRAQVAKVVHISLDDIDLDIDNLDLVRMERRASFLVEKLVGCEGILNGSGSTSSWANSYRKLSIVIRFIEIFLPVALVSFTGSHVCRFDMNLWGRYVDEIPVGLGLSFRCQELACLKGFIGGPAWVLRRSGVDDSNSQPGLKISLTFQDLQELWGPVWFILGTAHAGPVIRTERGFIVPLSQNAQPSISSGTAGEIECHWTRELPPFIDHRIILSHDSRILIGTDPTAVSTGGLTINLECESRINEIQKNIAHRFQYPGTCNERYARDGYDIQLTGGQYVNAGLVIKHKRIPAKTHKDMLLSTCYNSNINIRPLMKLLVGLEISACTGNARRISLWDALRLSQANETKGKSRFCKHQIYDMSCLQTCWTRHLNNKMASSLANGFHPMGSGAKAQGFPFMTDETSPKDSHVQDEMRQAIISSLEALQYTGVDADGNLQAFWPFIDTPTNYRIEPTRFNKWLDILADTRDVSTFAVMSQECLDFSEDYIQRPLNDCSRRDRTVHPKTCLSLRVLPQALPRSERGSTRRLIFGLSPPPDSCLTKLTPGSIFRIGKREFYVKRAWQGQQKVMVAYAISSTFEFGSKCTFQPQLNPEIKGMEPVEVVICSKSYGEA